MGSQLSVLPPVEEIQQSKTDRPRWIFYSALDAKTTYELYHALQVRLLEHYKASSSLAEVLKARRDLIYRPSHFRYKKWMLMRC